MLSELAIIKGSTEISMVDTNGWFLITWEPAVSNLEDGGVWADNKATGGRRPAFGVYSNIVEEFELAVVGESKSDVDGKVLEFEDILLAAFSYWVPGSKQSEVVYLKVQEESWSAPKYTPVHFGEFPNLPDLRKSYQNGAMIDGRVRNCSLASIILSLEHGEWSDQVPGQFECVETSNKFQWNYTVGIERMYEYSSFSFTKSLFYHAASGNIVALSQNGPVKVLLSTDDGESWTPVGTFTSYGPENGFITAPNGNIVGYGRGPYVYISSNGGSTWSEVSITNCTVIHSMVAVSGGSIIAVGHTEIYPNPVHSVIFRSTDNGQTWTTVYDAILDGSTIYNRFTNVCQGPNGHVFAIGAKDNSTTQRMIMRSTDLGLTWAYFVDTPEPTSSSWFSFTMISNGSVLFLFGTSIWRSVNNGLTWTKVYNSVNPTVTGYYSSGVLFSVISIRIVTESGGLPYAYYNYRLIRSEDGGNSWTNVTIVGSVGSPQSSYKNFLAYNSGVGELFFAYINNRSSDQYIGRIEAGDIIELGFDPTCADVPVSNRLQLSNLTNIWVDNGGVFTSIFPATSFPVALLPATPSANDAVYFMTNDTTINSGPFSNLCFDIAGALPEVSFTLVHEYYNGSGWVSLTVMDETNGFRNTGVNLISWKTPSNLTLVTVNGTTGYCVRIRVVSVEVSAPPPVQTNRQIFSVTVPRVSISDDQVISGIGAVSKIEVLNRSSSSGPLGDSGPYLHANRVVVGLKTRPPLDQFISFINIADEQNQNGIGISVGNSTGFVDLVTSPAGRMAVYTPAGPENMETRAIISIGPSLGTEFYGSYHCYLVGKRTGGSASDIAVRLEITTGSGGISSQTFNRRFRSQVDFEVLDFGEFNIPVDRQIKHTELVDLTNIKIQASAEQAGAQVNFYFLVLIPVDEWAGNFVDSANNGYSDIGRSTGVQKYLDIDSVTNPREDIESKVKTVDNMVVSRYNPASVGPSLLQPETNQDLWFFAMQTSGSGEDWVWTAPHEIVNTIQVFYASRYRSVI